MSFFDKILGPRKQYDEMKMVCYGCKYFVQQTVLFGRRENQCNHYCFQPEVVEELNKTGSQVYASRTIATRTSGPPITPAWCPYLKAKEPAPEKTQTEQAHEIIKELRDFGEWLAKEKFQCNPTGGFTRFDNEPGWYMLYEAKTVFELYAKYKEDGTL